jgi:hypothetical protein
MEESGRLVRPVYEVDESDGHKGVMMESSEQGIGGQDGKGAGEEGRYRKGPEVEAMRYRKGVEERGDEDERYRKGPEVEAQRYRKGPEA